VPPDYKRLADTELVQLARRELPYRTRAYEELMRRYEKLLFSICLRMAGNRQDAEDITQEVMLKVFSKLASFEGRAAIKTWLVRVTSNACKDWIKKKATARQYTEALANEPQPDNETVYAEDRLVGLLQELADADREVLTLRFVADLNLSEIADVTNLSLSATKMRLYRAVDRLQQLALDTYGDELLDKE
jgi:RNA polymerase sigma-70 factor (ECF subfamily)